MIFWTYTSPNVINHGCHMDENPIYKFTTSVCDGGFRGWGKGEAGEATGDPWRPVSVCDRM